MSITHTIPTYHSAPNYSIPPPDANGPLQLGSLLCELRDLAPLNTKDRRPVLEGDIFRSHKDRFGTAMSRQASGDMGIFAKLLGLDGVGGKLRINGALSKNEMLLVDRLDTMYFDPSTEYMKLAMQTPSVRAFRDATRDREPLFMVTGIKIARGASASAMGSQALGGGVEAGMPDLATGLVQIGATAGGEMSRESQMGFQSSSDFVLGYRVSLINMKKNTERPKVYTRGATFVSDDVQEDVDEDRGEPDAVHDFAPESMESGSMFLDQTGITDAGPCRWVLHNV
ncbi:uncharacterized protein Triagg1_5171 [Trichoderma aggressivum f. europaeum]|uniref:Uncharacterized protein n=1 Tax=Trichoderma aggressivum f. europaeum TaxID=173218 RepID=A0AAE1IDR7_9HYPO|nr:hypothetical protein Triagg1_5171 [Trichoderma aggressivum f. europaeum]